MAHQKMTFSLDQVTASRIGELARGQGKPKSAVVRDAVAAYAERSGAVSEAERLERARLFVKLAARIPARPPEEVEAELREVRRARRTSGRGTVSEP